MSQRGFAAIPNHVIRDSSLPASARLLYGIILSYAFGARRCTASTARLCEEAGIQRATFWRAIHVLVERKLLTVEKRKTAAGWHNTYSPRVSPLSVSDEDESEGSSQDATTGGSSHHCDGGSSHQCDTEEDQIEEDNSRVPNGTPSSKLDRGDEPQVIGSLIDYWKARCQHPSAKATSERRRKVQARLREGYTPQQIRTAIDGAAVGAFVNDAGKRFDDLELICRTGSKLESFIDRAPPMNGAHVGNVHPIRLTPQQQQAKATDARVMALRGISASDLP